MSKYLDLDDVAAQSPLAQEGLRALRARIAELERTNVMLENSASAMGAAWKRNASRVAKLEAAIPTLELVGGEWEHFNEWSRRKIGPYTISLEQQSDGSWGWILVADRCVADGLAPTREAAIEAAEKALLEEVKKFVRIKL